MMAGSNPAAVQRIMRHSNPKLTTEVYGYLSPQYLQGEVNRLKLLPPPKPFATYLLPAPKTAPQSENASGEDSTISESWKNGLNRNRTCDLRIRSPTLYPAEL